ncbi:MAG: hypothetical protein Tsb0013_12090 [Phycisphaerales bacterium]
MTRTDKERARLIALNAGLLLLLGAVTLAPMAEAQRGRSVRRAPGEYTMVASRPQGASEDALHIVDASNMELMTLRYDNSSKSLKFIDYRDLNADLEAAEQGQGR